MLNSHKLHIISFNILISNGIYYMDKIVAPALRTLAKIKNKTSLISYI